MKIWVAKITTFLINLYSHGFVYLMKYSLLVLLNGCEYLTFVQISNPNRFNTGCQGNIPQKASQTPVAR